LLLEPEAKLYSPFLRPLVDAADSKYVWHEKSGIVWSHLEGLLNKTHLPFQEILPADDPRLYKPNHSLLVVANLSFYPRKTFKGFGSLAQLVVHQYVSAIRSNSLFQKYGLIRMLIWIEDQERFLLLPRHVHLRKKGSMEAAVSCSHISEVASSTVPHSYFPRDISLELESTRKTLAQMEAKGITVPEGRRSVIHEYLLGIQTDAGLIDAKQSKKKWSEELPLLEARYAAGEFEKNRDKTKDKSDPTVKPTVKKPADPYTPEYKRMMILRNGRNSYARRRVEREDSNKRHSELLKRLGELHGLTTMSAQRERESILKLRRKLLDEITALPDANQIQFHCSSADNYRLSQTEPSGFIYDRREAEPLKVQKSDFYPAHELALIDFEPQTTWPSIRADNANYDILEYIATMFNMFPNNNVKESLTALWPGAYEWLSVECPSLLDPRKGGDPDLTLIRVRCLTSEHLKEILEAWIRWPFRPTREQIVARLSYSASADVESESLSYLGDTQNNNASLM